MAAQTTIQKAAKLIDEAIVKTEQYYHRDLVRSDLSVAQDSLLQLRALVLVKRNLKTAIESEANADGKRGKE